MSYMLLARNIHREPDSWRSVGTFDGEASVYYHLCAQNMPESDEYIMLPLDFLHSSLDYDELMRYLARQMEKETGSD